MHPSEPLPEGGERKRNLTTTGLGEKQRKSETRPVPTKSSQSPLRIRSVQVEGVKEPERPSVSGVN